MGQICSLCEFGDLKLNWDTDNISDIDAAEKLFNDLVIRKKYLAFKVARNNKKTKERIYSFNKEVEKIVLVPPLIGG